MNGVNYYNFNEITYYMLWYINEWMYYSMLTKTHLLTFTAFLMDFIGLETTKFRDTVNTVKQLAFLK